MRALSILTVVLAVALGAFAVAGCGGDDEAGEDEVTVQLNEFESSGQTGTATLTAEGEQTQVSIELDDEPVSASQPAHIHEGTCDNLTAEPAFGLPNVVDGSSETTVDVSLETLTSSAYAVNLHMSDDDLATYTSCGNIEG
jgi:hypothetical protein